LGQNLVARRVVYLSMVSAAIRAPSQLVDPIQPPRPSASAASPRVGAASGLGIADVLRL